MKRTKKKQIKRILKLRRQAHQQQARRHQLRKQKREKTIKPDLVARVISGALIGALAGFASWLEEVSLNREPEPERPTLTIEQMKDETNDD